ncbi:alpha/beta fold hydrolase [Kutzneria sp. NPDC051319]|uniref:alpha/beta fold hydrolase n=1 Tax=Kutzneria sp. NPDC051319 TaxID=3155047 RepID=UPI00342E98A8
MSSSAHTANDPVDGDFRSALSADVRRFLSRRLAPAMVPSRFVVVDDLPKLPNGKVDRARLPADADVGSTDGAADLPASGAEAAAAELWAQLLGRQRIEARSNFFELGGTSVSAVEMAARWTAATGVDVDLQRFLAEPTVRSLVRLTGDSAAGESEEEIGLSLSAVATLPADIRWAGRQVAHRPAAGVLVTEATTRTGLGLVRELLDRSATVVHVIVDHAAPAQAREQLRERLQWSGDPNRLVVARGDLARPYLGLEPQTYRDLSNGTQLVVHNGALMDPLAAYGRLFSVNVLGTQEVLRFAGTATVKPVHFVSTLSVSSWSAELGWSADTEPGLPELVGAMRKTLAVAEGYVMQAARRGIPGRIHRHGQLTAEQPGDQDDRDFLTALIRACIALNLAPDLDLAIPATPVDSLAAALVDTALSEHPASGADHVVAGYPVLWRELANNIRAAGRVLDIVPYERWRQKVLETVADGDLRALARFVPLIGEHGLSAALGHRPASRALPANIPTEPGRDQLLKYPSRLGGVRISHAGIVIKDHTVVVPLDHGDPSGPQIEIFAQEVVSADHEHRDLPWLLFLQGGPGGRTPRPTGATGWLEAALRGHRVLLLDQRGGGRSTPITVETTIGRSAADIASYIRHFRADSIVLDAELLRLRVAGGRPWTLLGQSYGGFIALNYLSTAPDGVSSAIVSGGVPSLGATADDVYARTYAQAVKKNEAYFQRYPEDVKLLRRLADHLDNNDVRLPNGDRLTTRRMRLMGRDFGMSDWFEGLHRVIAGAWDGGRISEPFQRAILRTTGFEGNPIYALQEFIYARPGFATNWAAQRMLANFPEFDEKANPLLLFAEMMFPWMFEEVAGLRPFMAAADLLAQAADMSEMYDPAQLANNKIPLIALLYADDPYTPNDLQQRTIEMTGNARVITTEAFHHNGLMRNSELLAGLLDLAARLQVGA